MQSRRYKKGRKGLLEYIQSPTRIKPLVGLHEVVEIRFTETGKRLAYCKMCNVCGISRTMREICFLSGLDDCFSGCVCYKYTTSLLCHFTID
ncbi:Hypothetical predicted protein [Pelobates cultripes]|uniref:Uncharacterized protein n=1 Tax=Pelobates cultripes TaxID=61616 RepID=A0AAD1RXW2_PELCU|nr:Hypothetical predicted protein [Pelobates cultripes]